MFSGGKFVRNAVVVQNTDGHLSLPVTNQGGQNTYFRIPDEDVIYNAVIRVVVLKLLLGR